MQAITSCGQGGSRYIFNECTALFLISINVIYSIAVGMLIITQAGLMKHVSWEDDKFRKIVYWSFSDVMVTAAIRLLYCRGEKKTALKVAMLMLSMLPSMPMFCAVAGREIFKERDGKLAVFFIANAMMSIAINALISLSASDMSMRAYARVIRSAQDNEFSLEEL